MKGVYGWKADIQMAQSPSHKLGQIIGNLLEAAFLPLLLKYCAKNNLYLDKAGFRPARKGQKVSWTDKYGNSHDLDFVMEKNGTDNQTGQPVAFIESAWRRYTKHSRNKAQEIQGAVLPLAETYNDCHPFLGAILAGEWTSGALNQLTSHGFSVLYFDYRSILKAFSSEDVDTFFDEKTSSNEFLKKIKSLKNLSSEKRNRIIKKLIDINKKEIDNFFNEMDSVVLRRVCSIRIFNLYGEHNDYPSIDSAIKAIRTRFEPQKRIKFIRFEIIVKFNNGDKAEAQFSSKAGALKFLRFFRKDI